MKLFVARRPNREITRQKENGYFTEPPHYMSHHIINYHISHSYHTISHYKPSRKWLLQKRLFWPKLWHYCHVTWFSEELLNVLKEQFELFWYLGHNPRSHIHPVLFNTYFLSAIWLPHNQFRVITKGTASLTNVNHCIFIIF